MNSVAQLFPKREPPKAIAPWAHTAGLIAILAAVTAYGIHLQTAAKGPQIAVSRGNLIGTCIGVIISEWALFFYCWRGMRRRTVTVADVVGTRWSDIRKVAMGLALSAGFWVGWEFVAWGMNRLVGPNHAKSIAVILPKSPTEIALWIVVSVSAGICEEFVFRGYLQRQLWALTRSAAGAIAAQAIVFGVSHGYQGLQKMAVISVLGVLYGVLAHCARNLRPGMIAHAWSDIYGGFF